MAFPSDRGKQPRSPKPGVRVCCRGHFRNPVRSRLSLGLRLDLSKDRRTNRNVLSLALAFLAGLPAGACDLYKALTVPVDVRFTVDREDVRVGEDVVLCFQVLKGGDGRRYWVGVVPEAQSLHDPSGCTEVAAGTKSIRLDASSPGPHEVRVYSDRQGPVLIVARRKLRVLP